MATALLIDDDSATGSGRSSATRPAFSYDDPLDQDRHDDAAVLATRRSLCRVALIAAKTASRFAREAQPRDAMAWMLAPRRLFAGASAIEAVMNREHCERALVLHGLSLGLDADPSEIDELRPDDWPTPGMDDARDEPAPARPDRGGAVAAVDGDGSDGDDGNVIQMPVIPRRLYSATIMIREPGLEILAYHASFALDYLEVFERLVGRFGLDLAGRAEVRKGFDAEHPLVPAEVAKSLLRAIADGPGVDERIDVSFERRTIG